MSEKSSNRTNAGVLEALVDGWLAKDPATCEDWIANKSALPVHDKEELTRFFLQQRSIRLL
jgi:hypothetical protein